MKIYKDIFTEDELFSDAYKIELVDDVIYEVHGMLPKPGSGVQTDDSSNSSEDDINEYEPNHVDVVRNYKLVLYHFYSYNYQERIREYTERVAEVLQKKSPDQVDVFKANSHKFIEGLTGRYTNFMFFFGESENSEGMPIILEYKDVDGKRIPVMYVFKHGLEEEIV